MAYNIDDKIKNQKVKYTDLGIEKEDNLLNLLTNKYNLIYFYPKDLTTGCTIQAENLTENFELLKEKQINIIGVSIDSCDKHKKFTEKLNIPFILISDEEKSLVENFGVWQEKSMYGKKYFGTKRTSFIINNTGKILSIIDKPKPKEHSKQILEEIEKLKK